MWIAQIESGRPIRSDIDKVLRRRYVHSARIIRDVKIRIIVITVMVKVALAYDCRAELLMGAFACPAKVYTGGWSVLCVQTTLSFFGEIGVHLGARDPSAEGFYRRRRCHFNKKIKPFLSLHSVFLFSIAESSSWNDGGCALASYPATPSAWETDRCRAQVEPRNIDQAFPFLV